MKYSLKAVLCLFTALAPACAWAQAYSGDNQVSVTTRTLPQPFIVLTGLPPNGGNVTFTVMPNAGAAGTFPGGATSAVVYAGTGGFAASPQLTANHVAGSFTVVATDAADAPVTFHVMTTPCVSPAAVSGTGDSVTDTTTLRYAVTNACAGSTITFASGLGSIKLGSRLRIDDNLSIQGPGSNSLSIDGQGTTRLFFIGAGSVSLSGLTLQNGLGKGGDSGTGGGAAGMGGAIFQNGGILSVANVKLINNKAQGGSARTVNGFGGAGFGGDPSLVPAFGIVYAGGNGGDLFGVGGSGIHGIYTINGGPGAGGSSGFGAGAGAGVCCSEGGNGGFGGGGGYPGGSAGFGGGGAGALMEITSGFPGNPLPPDLLIPNAGYGGGGGDLCYSFGYHSSCGSAGGGGAGFGGAIFEYAGSLSLINDTFSGNSAIGGSGEKQNGQGKGGALFIYTGANASSFASTFTADIAPDAGKPGTGSSAAPYTGGATCPSQDTIDICGTLVAASGAIFQGIDTTTQGHWPGQYGAGGYSIPNLVTTTLVDATLSFSQYFDYTWAGATADPRALRTSPSAVIGIASAVTNYYGKSFLIHLNEYDVKPHRLALYLLDWDTTSRSETIVITDADTGKVYDQETFSSFHNGEYATWQIKGNLLITVTPTAGPSAVVSGIFID